MDVDRWLAEKKKELSTSTLKRVYECLSRAVNRAMARDHVNRNVVALCEVPNGKPGRPSKSLNFNQAKALLEAATGTRLDAYIVLSLLLGARTEELRALTWSLVDLTGKPHTTPPIPPAIQVWRSVREDGDTKTRKSRRTLALPRRCCLRYTLTASSRMTTGKKRPATAGRTPISLRLRTRHCAGRGQRASSLSTDHQDRRAESGRVDSSRTAAQLRVPALRTRIEPRTNRGPLRPRRDDRDRDRLPPSAPPSPAGRGNGHGSDLQPGELVTHLVTRTAKGPIFVSEDGA